MSVNASKHGLIQLIYRHLKEHGYRSAADELQRHIPQGDAHKSASLLDIYSSWLSESKKKKKPNLTKDSNPKGTPVKATKLQTAATSNQAQDEDVSSSDSEMLSQSLLPQTPPASSKKSAPTTPSTPVAAASPKKKPVTPVTPVAAAPGESRETTDISEDEESAPAVAAKTKAGATSALIKTPKKKSVSTSGKTPAAASTTAVSAPPVATPKKKKEKSPKKAETQKKKSAPAKRKKGEGKSDKNVVKEKKSKTQTKGESASAGGDDSDSDSSLDVEKWKKLLLQMTEADVAKMDTINALDSSTPQPKKRVTKPRAKPPAKTDAAAQQDNGTADKNEKLEEKTLTETPARNGQPEKSKAEKTAPVSPSATPRQDINTVDRQAMSTLSPSKQTPKKEKRKADTPSGEKTEETPSDPKKKKRKKEKTGDKIEGNTNETGEGGQDKDGGEEKKNEIAEQEFTDKKTKTAKGTKGEINAEMVETNQNINIHDQDVSEPVVQEKKAKKKKKEKTDREEVLEQPAEETKEKKKKKKKKDESEEISEQIAEKIENTEQIVKEKKSKKKKKKDQDEESSEQMVEKEKKDKADRGAEPLEQMTEGDTAISGGEERPEQVTEAKKKKKKKDSKLKDDSADTEPLPPPNPETPEKKKKKSKLKSADVPETPAASLQGDAAAAQTPSSDSHKKKKKSSKSHEDV